MLRQASLAFKSATAWLAATAVSVLLNLTRPGYVDHLIGKLTRASLADHPQATPLRSLPLGVLASLVRRDPATRSVVLVRGYRTIAIGDLMAVATQPELAPMVALIVGWRDDVPMERSTEMYQTIALGAGGGPNRVLAALMVVAKAAETISTAQAEAILATCLNFAGQPVNPYLPPGLPLQAKATAVALLQEHPELDGQIYARCGPTSRGERSKSWRSPCAAGPPDVLRRSSRS